MFLKIFPVINQLWLAMLWLVASSSKQLPHSVLSQNYDAIWHHNTTLGYHDPRGLTQCSSEIKTKTHISTFIQQMVSPLCNARHCIHHFEYDGKINDHLQTWLYGTTKRSSWTPFTNVCWTHKPNFEKQTKVIYCSYMKTWQGQVCSGISKIVTWCYQYKHNWKGLASIIGLKSVKCIPNLFATIKY